MEFADYFLVKLICVVILDSMEGFVYTLKSTVP